MPELTPEMLADILGTVLEETAFMLVEPVEVPAAWEGPVLRSTLAFESVGSGTLRLLTAEEPAGRGARLQHAGHRAGRSGGPGSTAGPPSPRS